MMEYRVWVIDYDPTTFSPADWQQNPDSGVAFMPVCPYWPLQDAINTAHGFNDREIARPMGKWAIVCRQGNEPESGNTVVLKGQDIPQPSNN